MGFFDYFFASSTKKSAAEPLVIAHSTPEPQPLKYDASGAAIFNNHKVLAINDGQEDDDFIQVDFRKLSYAEVAALKSSQRQAKNCAKSSGAASNAKNIKPAANTLDIVDVNQDLGTDITDYQLAEAIQKQMDARDLQAAIEAQKNYLLLGSGQNDELNDFADKFDNKTASIKQNKKHKKHKKDKLKLAQHTYLS